MIDSLVIISQVCLISLTSVLMFRIYQLSQIGSFATDTQSVFKVARDSVISAFKNSSSDKDSTPSSARSAIGTVKKSSTATNSSSRIDSFAKAQIFAGIQMLDLKQQGVCLDKHQSDWLIHSIAAYFHGAVEQITDYFNCSNEDKEDIVTFLITRNLSLNIDDSTKLINLRLLGQKTDLKDTVNAGKEAAKIWLEKRSIPSQHSLFASVNECGFIV